MKLRDSHELEADIFSLSVRHPQIINALETAAAAAVTGAVIAALVWLSTKLERRRIHQAVK